MLQRRRSRCRPTAATLSRFSTRHPPPATLLSHSSVSTTPPPLNPPSKQPSIITKAPALYVRIAPIHPPSKGLISALPLELVLLPPPAEALPPHLDWQENSAFRCGRYYTGSHWICGSSFFLNRSSPSSLEIFPGDPEIPVGSLTGVVIGNCRINYKLYEYLPAWLRTEYTQTINNSTRSIYAPNLRIRNVLDIRVNSPVTENKRHVVSHCMIEKMYYFYTSKSKLCIIIHSS